jgi:type I restriction enzyme S subunit
MEIRKGYKQTEIGIIPEDWEVKELENIAGIKMGQSPNSFNYNTKGIGLPLIQGKADILGRKTVSSTFTTEITRTCKAGDLIMTVRAPVGYISKALFDACIGRGVCSIRYKNDFLYYYLILQESNWESLSKGSTYDSINSYDVKVLKVPLPPLPEQTAIAIALSDIDALIESLEKLITKKRNIKQGVMQQLLTGKKRLPGYGGDGISRKGYKQTEMGIIPEDWELKRIKEFGEIVTGSTPSTKVKEYWNGEIPWITPTDILGKKDIFYSERLITNLGLSVIRKIPKNSLLVTCIASIGKNTIIRKDGACNQQINAILPNSNYIVDYLYYLFEGSKQYLLSKAGITATNIISKNEFSEILFPVPSSVQEQTAITEVLSDMDLEIEALEKKLDKYKKVKQGMMQELLTGKKRLI